MAQVSYLQSSLSVSPTHKCNAGYSSKSAQTLLSSIGPSPLDEQFLSTAPGGAPFGINFRTLGDVAYFMTSLNTPSTTIRSVEDRIWKALDQRSR